MVISEQRGPGHFREDGNWIPAQNHCGNDGNRNFAIEISGEKIGRLISREAAKKNWIKVGAGLASALLNRLVFYKKLKVFTRKEKSFVMRPHAQHLYGFYVIQNMINEPVLDVDTTGACTGQIAYKFFEWRWRLVWVFGKEIQKFFSLRPQPRSR